MNQAAIRQRAVVIHGRAHAVQALAEARGLPGRPILLSAPAAAGFLGPPWWLALIRSVQAPMAECGAADLLDCGSAAGRAMEALRLGARRLVLSPECPQFDAVLARALPLGALIERSRPAALDLAEDHAARGLRRWLEGNDKPAPLG